MGRPGGRDRGDRRGAARVERLSGRSAPQPRGPAPRNAVRAHRPARRHRKRPSAGPRRHRGRARRVPRGPGRARPLGGLRHRLGRERHHRHGLYGIFLSRLLPVWRAVVAPFAGIAGLPPAPTLLPLALASALWYGALTFLVTTLGANFDEVVRVLHRVNAVLTVVAVVAVGVAAFAIHRRLRR